MSKITRRDFIKQAGLASAGLMLGGVALSNKSYARVKGANDRVNVGVVGFSDRSAPRCCPASSTTKTN